MSVLKIKKNGSWVEVWGGAGSGTGGSGNANAPRLTTITLLADAWIGNAEPYSQVVSCRGVNVNSKVDLQPTPAQISELQDAEISLMATNTNGVVTVYSLNDKPSIDMEIQVLITDVEVIA